MENFDFNHPESFAALIGLEVDWGNPGLREPIAKRLIQAITERDFFQVEAIRNLGRRNSTLDSERSIIQAVNSMFSDGRFRTAFVTALRDDQQGFSTEDKNKLTDLLELRGPEEDLAFSRSIK